MRSSTSLLGSDFGWIVAVLLEILTKIMRKIKNEIKKLESLLGKYAGTYTIYFCEKRYYPSKRNIFEEPCNIKENFWKIKANCFGGKVVTLHREKSPDSEQKNLCNLNNRKYII